MAWFGPSSEWKQSLSPLVLGKVEELENLNEKLKREKNQKQTQLDTLQQALEKQKRKTDEEVKQRQAFEKETEQFSRSCEQLQEKLRCVSDHNLPTSLMSHNSVLNVGIEIGSEKQKQRKIEELESENRILHEKISILTSKDHVIQTPVKASNRDDFWSHFSQQQISLPQKSPHKVSIKKALETSEENPFKAPPITPLKKEVKSNMAPTSTSVDTPFKVSNKLEGDSLAITSTGDFSFNEPQATHKFQAGDASIMLEKSEQKLKHLQTELECQRHNYETLKKRLDDIVKEKERELNIESSRFLVEIGAADQKIKELTLKLQQQETLAMNKQNILQASLDKAKLQLLNSEKDNVSIQSRCSQLETSVNQYEKCEEDKKKLITQLKLEKDMFSSQVDSLKIKLTDSDSQINCLQVQLEKAEQLCIQQKESIEYALDNNKSIEKERATLTQSIEALQNKNEEVDILKVKLAESNTQFKQLQVQLENSEQSCTQYKASLDEALENYQSLEKEKNSFNHSIEAINKKEMEIERLNVKLAESNSQKSCLQVQLENSERLCILNKASVEEIAKNLRSLEKERDTLIQSIDVLRNVEEKFSEMEKSAAIAQQNEEKAKEEKLAAELSVWELEGTLDGLKKDLECCVNEKKLFIELKSQEKQELQKQVFQLEDTIFAKNATISSLELQVTDLKKRCEDFANVVKSLNIALEEGQADIKSKQEKVKEAEANEAELENTLRSKKAALDKLELELETKSKLIEEMSLSFDNKLKEKEEAIIKTEAIYMETTTNNMIMKEEIERINNVLKENDRAYELQISDLENLKFQCENEVKSLKQEVAELSVKFGESKLKDQVNLDLNFDLNKKLNEKQAIITKLNCDIVGFQFDITRLNTEKEELTNKVNNLELEFTNMSDLNKILENQLSEKDSLMQNNDSVIESLRQRYANLLKQRQVTKDIILEQATCLQKFADELSALKVEKEEIENLYKELQKSYDEFNAHYEEIKMKLNDTDIELLREQAMVKDKNSDILILTAELNELKEMNTFMIEEMKKLKLSLSEIKIKNQTLCNDKENLAKEMHSILNERFPDLESRLKLKEEELAETQRGTLEIRAEFDNKMKEMNENIYKLENELLNKEKFLSQLESKFHETLEKNRELEMQLNTEQMAAYENSIKFECYKEVVKLMERETTSDNSKDISEIRSENEALLDKINECSCTNNKQGKHILTLQKMNMKLKTKLSCIQVRYQDVDVQTDYSINLNELQTKHSAEEERNVLQSQLELLLQKVIELELNGKECEQSLRTKCAEFEELQSSYTELLNSNNQREQEIIKLNKRIEDIFIDHNALLTKVTGDLKEERMNHQNICSKMVESQKSIERYKLGVAGLKAKFSLNQRSITKKDKEIEQSLKINISLKDAIHKIKQQLNEERNKRNQLCVELTFLKDIVKEKENKLIKYINLYDGVVSKLNENEIKNQNMKQKLSKLQVQNKSFQIMASKRNVNTFLNTDDINKKMAGKEIHGFHCPEHQSSGEVVECSQPGGDQLPTSISSGALFGRFRGRIRGRRSHCRRKTTGSLVMPVKKEGEEKLHFKSESISNTNAQGDLGDISNVAAGSGSRHEPLAENFSTTPRRVTRLSSSRESIDSYFESGKRSPLSRDSVNSKRQKLTMNNSSVEGLPYKTEKGLNDIPIGLESPGVMRRSTTTSLQKTNVAQMSPRGPLRLRDTNCSFIHPSSRTNI